MPQPKANCSLRPVTDRAVRETKGTYLMLSEGVRAIVAANWLQKLRRRSYLLPSPMWGINANHCGTKHLEMPGRFVEKQHRSFNSNG
jgi:hypothetical protein